MKPSLTVMGCALSVARSRWLQSALFSLAFAAFIFGVTGCASPHH
jgi:hypothetical protein